MIRLLIAVLLTGCTTPVLPEVRFGPDPYQVKCVDGETWLIADPELSQIR